MRLKFFIGEEAKYEQDIGDSIDVLDLMEGVKYSGWSGPLAQGNKTVPEASWLLVPLTQ